MKFALLGFGPWGLVAVSFLLFWIVGLRRNKAGWGTSLLKVIAWMLLLQGVGLGVISVSQWLALVWLVLIGVVIVSAVQRFLQSEKQALLWSLTMSAERGIPLSHAAVAFASESRGWSRDRANLLAGYLNAGTPLSLALERSGNSLSPVANLAADMGQQTGTLGSALREVVTYDAALDPLRRSTIERLFYLAFVVFTGAGVLSFVMLKIMPVIAKMYEEFGLELPRVTQALVTVSDSMVQAWFLWFPLVILGGAVLLVGLVQYLGFSVRRVFLFRRLARWTDSGWILRWLSIGVETKRPISDIVRLLAGYFPNPPLRRQLDWCARQIEHGMEWSDSLRRARLIRKSEAAILRSAERVGNLSWALKEIAAQRDRRLLQRLQLVIAAGVPLAVILLGGVVFFISLGMFVPLIALIQGMS